MAISIIVMYTVGYQQLLYSYMLHEGIQVYSTIMVCTGWNYVVLNYAVLVPIYMAHL